MTADPIVNLLEQRSRSPITGDRVVTAEETLEWPSGTLERFMRDGVVEEIEPATSAECTGCDEGHVEIVQVVEEPPGSERRHYISCPDVGRVQIDPAMLRRWQVVEPASGSTILADVTSVLPPTKVILQHSDDYQSVSVGARHWPLAPREAKAVQILHVAYSKGTGFLPWKRIQIELDEAGFAASRMNDILRSIPDANDLIISPRRGYYGLNL